MPFHHYLRKMAWEPINIPPPFMQAVFSEYARNGLQMTVPMPRQFYATPFAPFPSVKSQQSLLVLNSLPLA